MFPITALCDPLDDSLDRVTSILQLHDILLDLGEFG